MTDEAQPSTIRQILEGLEPGMHESRRILQKLVDNEVAPDQHGIDTSDAVQELVTAVVNLETRIVQLENSR